MTTDDWLRNATIKLHEAGVDLPQMEARAILERALGLTREELVVTERSINSELPDNLLKRRLLSEPLAYVLGNKEFFGRDFYVDSRVLIPRPETELLAEFALGGIEPGQRCADIGTGSGCLGVTLALEAPHSRWICTDTSVPALAVADANANALGANVLLLQGSLLDPFQDASVDLVVSNPPYVAIGDPALNPDVARWEPDEALYAGTDGLDAIKQLIVGAERSLRPGGKLIFEFGLGQAANVQAFLSGWSYAIAKDLAGIERIAIATRPISV